MKSEFSRGIEELIASADHGAAGAMATRVSRETPRCPPAGDRRRRRDRRGHGVVGVVHARRARPLENGHGLLPGRPLVRSPHRPCRHAGRAGRRRGEGFGGQAADKARSAQGDEESSGDCEICQRVAPSPAARTAKALARPGPGRALAATKRIGVHLPIRVAELEILSTRQGDGKRRDPF
jgi:hypothetical protein